MHAFGFWHEHQRPNRDEYLIVGKNRRPGTEKNFVLYKNAEYPCAPYDIRLVQRKISFLNFVSLKLQFNFSSIMRYEPNTARDTSHYNTKVLQPTKEGFKLMIGKTYYDYDTEEKIEVNSWREAEKTFERLETFKDITTYMSGVDGFVGFSHEGTELDRLAICITVCQTVHKERI